MTTRETIMEGLKDHWLSLKTGDNPTFRTVTRRWQNWQDDPSAVRMPMPALVQYEVSESTVSSGRGMLPVRTWEVHLFCYALIPDAQGGMVPGVANKTTPGASVVNALIDAIEESLAPPDIPRIDENWGTQTLGGLVIDCWIEGTTVKVLGDGDPSGLCAAIIPVKILVP